MHSMQVAGRRSGIVYVSGRGPQGHQGVLDDVGVASAGWIGAIRPRCAFVQLGTDNRVSRRTSDGRCADLQSSRQKDGPGAASLRVIG
jgi:hypothetical protein